MSRIFCYHLVRGVKGNLKIKTAERYTPDFKSYEGSNLGYLNQLSTANIYLVNFLNADIS